MSTRTRGRPRRPPVDKPPYRVPTMEEIRQLPWNGFNAVSTFSGAGGSSLGYRMAGFRMLWASADLTLSLFTLQFLPLPARLAALTQARAAAADSGALIVAEKIRVPDSRWAEIGNDASHDYKAGHGVTDAAIRAKAKALRGVLRPHPAWTLSQLIQCAGWEPPEVLFRWHTWQVVGAFAAGSRGGDG